MKFTESEINGLIQEAVKETFNRLLKEYKEERQPSRYDVFFDGEKMEQVRAWLDRCGWELVDMFKHKPETKQVKYFVVPSNGEKAKGEWAMCAGRISEIFGQQVKQGALKKDVVDAKAKKSKKYDPSADENTEKTGTHWFILTRDDLDWDKITSKYIN